MGQMETFAPTKDNSRKLRDALGRFATGVTVVTVASPDGPMGFTANSFASVSLDPPLVMWCPAKSSNRFEAYTSGKPFAIHVLSAAQEEIGNAFAKEPHAFDGLDWEAHPDGTPLLKAPLARFHCAEHAIYDGGDHVITVGRVLSVTTQPGEPLLFASGTYGRFTQG
ncbi:MAG: flavin reductase family protein [Pseudomonadota bacterium]